MNSSFARLFLFEITNSGYGSTGFSYHDDTIIEFSLRRDSSTGYTIRIEQFAGGISRGVSTTSHTFSTAPRVFRLFNATSGGETNRNFYFNELRVLAVPNAPTGVSITPGNGSLSVAFTTPSNSGGSAITNYEFSTNGGTSFTAVSPASTSSPIVISGLANGTPYNIQIRAVNGVGSGTATSSTSATPRTTPGVPTGLALTPGNGTLTATFFAPDSNGGSAITNYEYSTNGGSSFTAVNPASTSTSIAIPSLNNGTSYNVQVRAVNAAGSGTATASVVGTPRTTPTVTTGSATSITTTTVTLGGEITNTGGANATKRGIFWSTTNNFANGTGTEVSASGSFGTGAFTVDVSGLTQSTVYYFRAFAENGAGRVYGATQGTFTTASPAAATLTAATVSTAVPNSTYGTASGGASFTAAGNNLTGSITVTAQTGFQVATSQNGTYGADVTVSSGATVWVRAAATRQAGTFNSTIVAVLSGGGAASPANVTSSSSGNSVAQLAITGSFTASDKTYDGANTATVATRAVSGKIGSDDVNHTGGTATFDNANVGTGKTVTLTGATLTGAAASNYTLSSVSTTTANITALAITGSFTASNKTYDGTAAATVATRAVSGKIGSDDVNHTGGTATFNNATVGTGKTVTLTGASLTGAAAGNYTLSSVSTTTADITALAITGTFTANDKVYDGTTAATVATRAVTGKVGSDDVNHTGGTATFNNATAGTGKTVTLTGATLTGAAAGNYTLSSVSTTTAAINKATPSVTVNPTASGILYAQALSASTFSGGTVSPSGGSWAWTTPATIPAPGTATYSATYTPTDTTNYNTATANVSVTSTMAQARNKGGLASPAQPATIFLGDKDLTFEVETWGQIGDNWGQPRLYIRHNNSDVTGGSSTAYGSFTNSNLKTINNSPQFTNTGTWYWAIRMNYSAPYGSDFWYKSSNANWTAMSTNGANATLSVTVSELNNPTNVTASAASPTSITVSWANGVSGTEKFTTVFRSTSSTPPALVQGTEYALNADHTLGGQTYRCIALGLGTSVTDTGLTPGTTYYYYVYAENFDHYSSGVTRSVALSSDFDYNNITTDTVDSTALTGSGNLTKSGNAELFLTGNNTYTGKTTINAGRLRINADSRLGTAPTSAVADSITIGNATLALDGTITLNSNRGITLSGTATIDDWGNDDIYNGIIATATGATTSLTKTGGGNLTLGGNSTYTGLTTVNNGTLTITHASALGAAGANNGTLVASGNGLTLSGNIAIGNELLTLNGVGPVVSTVDTGALRSASGTNTWGGAITLASNARINADSGARLTVSGGVAATNRVLFIGDAGSVVIDSQISGTGATQDGTLTTLYKSGNGTLTLSASNSYTGDTRISRGLVVANAAGSLGTGSDVRIAANGSLTVSNNVTVGSIREWGTTNGGTVELASGATLTINGANKGEHFQNSISGAGGLTMSGSGTTQLSLYGTQSYTGTTTVTGGGISTSVGMSTTNVIITGGTFFLDSGGNIDSADITLGSGGSLDIDGTTTGRSLATNKVLTASGAGTNATATIAVDGDSSFSLGAGSLIFSAYGGGTNAPLTVSGTGGVLNLNSRGITVNTTTQLAAGSYKLIAKSGSASVTNTPGALTLDGSGSVGTASLGVTNGELILTVAKGTPTITTLPTASAINFGQTLASSTLSGGAGSVPGRFDFTTSSNAPNAGTQSVSVTFTPNDTANYNTVTTNINVTVNAVSLPTVTFTAPDSLVYNRTAKTYSASASGVTLTLTYTGRDGTTYGPATTAPTNVGNYTVTATTSDTNYTGSQAQNFSITAKGITGSFTAANKEYDGNANATVTGRSLTGVETGDTVTLDGGTATFADANAGTGKTVTLIDASLTGPAASNYSLTSVATTTANITKATPTITTAPTATAISVGQALSDSTLSGGVATGVGGSVLGGAFAFTSPNTTPGVGTANQSVTFTPTDTMNYNTATTSASVTVNSSIPVVTASTFSGTVGVAFNQSISDTGSPTSYAITSGTLPAGLSFNTTTGEITGTPTTVVSGATVQVTATNSNGTSEAATITFNIAKGSSTVAVTGSTTIFTYNGSAQGPATVSSSGSTGAVTFSYSGSGFGPSATPPVNVGSYSVTATLAEDANYNGATSAPQVFSIIAASLPSTTFTQGANGVFTASAPGVTNWNYLYVGRTNIPGLNTNSYAFLTYTNTNAPTAPGFYTVTATSADPNFTGSTNEHYAISGPLSKPIEVTKVQGTTNARFNRTTMLGTVQRVDTNGVLHTGVTNLVWTNGTTGGVSQMPSGHEPMTMSNTVTFDNIVVRLTPPGNGASLTDSFTLRVTDGHTPVDFPVTVTSTALPPFELQARRMIPNGDGTMTAIFVTRPNRNIEMMFRTNIASTNWAYVTSTSNVVQVDGGLQPQNLLDGNHQPRGTNIPTGQSGVIQLKVPAGGQMFFRARQVTP